MAEAINEIKPACRPEREDRRLQTATTLGETSRETPPHITGTEKNG